MAESTFERSAREPSPSPSPSNRQVLLTVVVRGLAVAGLAGAAWLLSSSAAHAAEESGGDVVAATADAVSPATSALTGLIGLDLGSSEHPAGERAAGERSVGVSDLRTGSAGNRTNGPTALVTGLVAVLGSGVTEGRHDPVTAATDLLTAALPRAATDLVRPAYPAQPRLLEPIRQPDRSVRAPVRPAYRETVVPTAAPAVITAEAKAGTQHAGAVTHRAGDRPAAGTRSVQSPVGDRADRINPQGTHHAPLQPRPGPVTGWASGSTSVGSGLSQDGGAGAVVPAAVATTEVAVHRSDAAADVEVRRLCAESPTVSPD